MINNLSLTGRTTSDIELKQTKSGVNACMFTLAVRKNYKDASGEYGTNFINCVAFDKTAEFLANYVKKGHIVGVEGELNQRTFQDKNDVTVSILEVSVRNVILMQPKDKDESKPASKELPF
jgi:single-strand DNA-binding protein